MRWSRVVFFLLVLGLLTAGLIFYFRDGKGPEIVLSPGSGPVSPSARFTLEVSDPGSGLRKLTVDVIQKESVFPVLAEKRFDPGVHQAEERISLAGLGLEEEPFRVRIKASDRSLRGFGKGNRAEQVFTLEYDSRPPTIAVLSTAHNLNQGGAGVAVYSLSEEAARSGVAAKDLFFPGHLLESGRYAAFFAFPVDIPPAEFVPVLLAADRAGNEGRAGIFYRAKRRRFREVRIELTDHFLNSKMPEFQILYPEAGSPMELFLLVNRQLREQNRATLRDLGRQTAARPLWEGAFVRQPRSSTQGEFGEVRHYYYQGKKIDDEVHLGIDLASVVQAPVLAANSGRVIFAESLGIYGQCVIIDHGLGLQSLYGHLSRIAVHAGEEVKKGQVISHTGTTGLAGGDHLHFAVLVSGVPVNPVEWWDADWVRNNVTGKLGFERKAEG